MKLDTIDSIVARLFDVPPVGWENVVDNLCQQYSASELDDLRSSLDMRAGYLAYLSEYISQRGGCHGCGARDHGAAAKSARKQAVKVNKALGYTYAERRVPTV